MTLYHNADVFLDKIEWHLEGHQKLRASYLSLNDKTYSYTNWLHGYQGKQDKISNKYTLPRETYTTTLSAPIAFFDPMTGDLAALQFDEL